MLRLLLRPTVRRCVVGHQQSYNTSPHLLHEQIRRNVETVILTSSNPAVSFFSTTVAAAEANLKTSANVESVTALLKEYGFCQSHLSLIAAKLSAVFNTYSPKVIRPKLEFFLSVGFTGPALVNLISKDPRILKSSLKRLSTNFNLLNSFLGEDNKAISAVFASSSWIIRDNPNTHLLPNIATLLDHGVSSKNISRLLKWHPRALTINTGRFSRSASLIKELGFEPSKSSFVIGVHVLSWLSQATWEKKIELYMSFGWSKEETISTFRKSPHCMLISEEKVRKVMNSFVENLKWKPSQLASVPIVLHFNFEKRVLPRYAVFSILRSKGFVGTKLRFSSTLFCSESVFLQKYVFKYSDQIPELLEAYNGNLNLAEAKLDS